RVAGVFHYDRNSRYTLTFKEARLACERDFGATIADMRQLQAANEGGLEECRAGWISGAEVAYPRVHLNWNCGQNQTGIISYGIRNDLLEKWDVFCYKMDDDCAMFQEAEMPGLPSVGPRRNGSNENCTVDVMTTMVTPSQLDFTIGTTGVTSETTTAMSCGGFLYEEDGDFQSPGFPHAYLSDMDCSWVIVVQPGHLVQLNFRAMVLEEHRGCQYDYISVFDELPPPLRSSSNVMTVQMKSDSSVELDGFSAQFHTVKSAEVTGHVKLRRGRNQFEGHVEVDIEGIQGGICAKHWGIREATVVCRQLGFTGSAMAERMPERMDDPPVSVSLVKCRGDEGSLDQCELKRGGGCSTAVRAAVHCRGESQRPGRKSFEMCIQGVTVL
ncbi:hypothetical protein JZ751_010846, partial [Albula glossodonta]